MDQKVGKLPAIASHTCNFFQNYSGGKNIESFCSTAQKFHWLFSVRVDFKIESVFIAGKQKENEIIYIFTLSFEFMYRYCHQMLTKNENFFSISLESEQKQGRK